jgi:phosphohistidine phosphatase SixA
MLIYLRHGDDRGDDVYRHDRRLNDRGREKAFKQAKRLIEKYGHPDVVHVSPFRRALETLEAMSESFGRAVPVHRDARIAQRLSEKQQRDPQVSPETRTQVVIVEDRDAFRRRVAEHVAEVRRHADQKTIWCISHQAVIEEVAEHFDKKISGDLDFLDHVVMFG